MKTFEHLMNALAAIATDIRQLQKTLRPDDRRIKGLKSHYGHLRAKARQMEWKSKPFVSRRHWAAKQRDLWAKRRHARRIHSEA